MSLFAKTSATLLAHKVVFKCVNALGEGGCKPEAIETALALSLVILCGRSDRDGLACAKAVLEEASKLVDEAEKRHGESVS